MSPIEKAEREAWGACEKALSALRAYMAERLLEPITLDRMASDAWLALAAYQQVRMKALGPPPLPDGEVDGDDYDYIIGYTQWVKGRPRDGSTVRFGRRKRGKQE